MRALALACAVWLGAGAAQAQEAPPAPPADHAADALFDPAAMARARAALVRESGGMAVSQVMVDQAEVRGGGDYAWEAKGWWGGDVDRVYAETRGEGAFSGRIDRGEVQAGWLHALDPWFNLRAGLRQDLGAGQGRTHAALTVEGLAPYWFDVEAALFVSMRGEVSGRAEASYDQKITQRLVLQPRVELDWAAQAMRDRDGVRARDRGAGMNRSEAALRLRYELRRNLAPYLGLAWERQTGGERMSALRALAGVRLWW
jgi:copper resistance protein B